MSTLMGKLTKHEHDLKRYEASERNEKQKEKNKDEKKNISFKVSTSKANVEDDEDDTK